VASQCKRWNVESIKRTPKDDPIYLKRTHLYDLLGKIIFPYLVEHTAGFMQYYYEIVNHPPYVTWVWVSQREGRNYDAELEDIVEKEPGKDNIQRLKSRTLNIKTDKAVDSGRTVFTVGFSEPVEEVQVMLGNMEIDGSLGEERLIWSGTGRIPDDGSLDGVQPITIKAKDRNEHYNDEGGLLDSVPRTPARRTVQIKMPDGTSKLDQRLNLDAVDLQYAWEDYQPGADTTHRIKVSAQKTAEPAVVKGRNAYWFVYFGGAPAMLDILWGTMEEVERKGATVLSGPFHGTREEVWPKICNEAGSPSFEDPSGHNMEWNKQILVEYKGYKYHAGRLWLREEDGTFKCRFAKEE
jgi:hypothetical protein